MFSTLPVVCFYKVYNDELTLEQIVCDAYQPYNHTPYINQPQVVVVTFIAI